MDIRFEIYLNTVLSFLPTPDAEDLDIVRIAINQLYYRGWTVGENVALHSCMVEFKTELDEEAALKKMKEIENRVKVRLAKKE